MNYLKKIGLALCAATVLAVGSAQAAITNTVTDSSAITTELDSIANSAIGYWNVVETVILAMTALFVLIFFIRKVMSRR